MERVWDILSAIAGGVAEVTLAAAPWLLLGLVIAGVLRAWLPDRVVARGLGGRGVGAVIRAALVGTPLPLCSCGVLPAAIGLRRQGASKEATVSFLVATPENGADSIALTWALMGPFMAVARVVAALVSALFAGVVTTLLRVPEPPAPPEAEPTPACCAHEMHASATCCAHDEEPDVREHAGPLVRLRDGLRYAFVNLLDDLALWLVVGVVLAGVLSGLVPQDTIGSWGSGLGAMVLMAVVGVPLYVCATSWTPVGASLIVAGMSPGTVLVLLLAGPATNLGTIGIVRRELGGRTLIAYLGGVCGMAIVMGLATDAVIGATGIDVAAQASRMGHFLPHWLSVGSAALLGLLLLRPLAAALASRPRGARRVLASDEAPVGGGA